MTSSRTLSEVKGRDLAYTIETLAAPRQILRPQDDVLRKLGALGVLCGESL
jgi:hypothetical protein